MHVDDGHKIDADFQKTSLLDTVIPEDTTTELSKLLESHLDGPNDSTRLLPLKERDLLFFGTQDLLTVQECCLTHCQIRRKIEGIGCATGATLR